MVGIARSKACHACRNRRKKCDEARPTCGLCKKRGIDCVFKSDLNVILVHPGGKTQTLDSWSDSDTTIVASTPIGGIDSCSLSPIDLPSSYLNYYFQGQLRGCMLEEYFPTAGRQSASIAWLADANEMSATDPLISDALDALSYSNVERQARLQTSGATDRSRMLYGKTIRRLAERLGDINEVSGDATLATVMILAAYEAQTAHNGNMTPWLSHIQGAAQLVQLRGKKNGTTELGRKLFLGTRLTYLIYLIGTRKAVKETPAIFGSAMDPFMASYAKLFQILLALPGIMEQSDSLEAQINNGNMTDLETPVSQLSYLCRDLESQLSNWSDQLLALEGGGLPLYWEEPSDLYTSLPPDSEARVYPLTFNFINIDVAQQLVLKWVALLVMNCLLDVLHEKLKSCGHSASTLFATDDGSDETTFEHHALATNITKSLEYLSFPQMGLSIVNFLGLPLNMTYGYWNARLAKERFFFSAILARVQTMNTGAGAFIAEMAKNGGGGMAFRKLLIDKQATGSPALIVP